MLKAFNIMLHIAAVVASGSDCTMSQWKYSPDTTSGVPVIRVADIN